MNSDPNAVPGWIPTLYFSFNLVGAGLLLLLVSTLAFLSPLHTRRATLLNLCVAWIVWPLAQSYLLFAREVQGPPPTYGNCLASASFVIAVSPIGSSAALSLVLQMYVSVVHPIQGGMRFAFIIALLIVGPWVIGLAFLIAGLIVGRRYPSLVTRGKLYCIINSTPLTDLSSIVVVLAMAGSILLVVLIAFKLRQSYFRSHRVGTSGDYELYLRVMVFGVYVLFALVAGAIGIVDYTSLVPDMISSTVPLVGFLIFASQRDVLTAWHLRKSHGERSAPATASQSASRSNGAGHAPFAVQIRTTCTSSSEMEASSPSQDIPARALSEPALASPSGGTATGS